MFGASCTEGCFHLPCQGTFLLCLTSQAGEINSFIIGHDLRVLSYRHHHLAWLYPLDPIQNLTCRKPIFCCMEQRESWAYLCDMWGMKQITFEIYKESAFSVWYFEIFSHFSINAGFGFVGIHKSSSYAGCSFPLHSFLNALAQHASFDTFATKNNATRCYYWKLMCSVHNTFTILLQGCYQNYILILSGIMHVCAYIICY